METSGFGFGSEHTALSTGDFRTETSRVERSDLRGVIPIFGHITSSRARPAEWSPREAVRHRRSRER
jgi:hypothetical protein